jgi:hypothetical protein
MHPSHALTQSSDVQVGYFAAKHQAERKSGAQAWSMRVHDVLVELPYPEVRRWSPRV